MIADYRGGSVSYTRKRLGVFPLLAVALILYAAFIFIRGSTGGILSPVPDDPEEKKSTIVRSTPKKSPEELRMMVQNAIGNSWVNYSVLVVDFNSDYRMGLNESAVYDGASVNKVPILAALYAQAGNGKVDLKQEITIQTRDIQDYGTGVIRYQPPGTKYTIRELARLMMQKSDNTAAYVISNRVIGLAAIQALVDSWGMTQTDMTENTTSNQDAALLFRKIYRREIANRTLTDEMLAFMTDSDFEERIPGLLPESTAVYHKIGNQVGVIHDAGIVSDANVLYYVGFLTSSIRDEEGAKALEAKLSKIIYDYMREV
jgi:beta-lactamase class A